MVDQDNSSDDIERLVDEWIKHFEADKLGILDEKGMPKTPGFLTVSQAISLFMAIRAGTLTELTAVEVSKGMRDYAQLMLIDIAKGKINVVHPVTYLARSSYMEMIENGMVVDIKFPYFDPGWLISINDVERWYGRLGIVMTNLVKVENGYRPGNDDAEIQPPDASLTNQPSGQKHQMKARKNELDAVIEIARKMANDPGDHNSVWFQLKELAMNGEPPFMGIVDANGLHYTSGSCNSVRQFTKEALRHRMNRLKK